MTIKNIVMAGGAYNGLYIVGALKYLIENSFFDINNIETIYGTSVGGFIGVLFTPRSRVTPQRCQCHWLKNRNKITHTI